MNELSRINSEDQQILKFAPLWVFLLVSKIDGKMDEKEYRQFVTDINQLATQIDPEIAGDNQGSALIRDIFVAVAADFESLSIQVSNYALPQLEALKKAGTTIEQNMSKTDALLFKKILMSIAVNVADSSGGWSLLGRNISKVEIGIINDIKKAIGYYDS